MSRSTHAALILLAATTTPLAAQAGFWREDERVVLTDLSVVEAVAANDTRVFVATTGGLGLYDPRFHRWAPPVTAVDGYPNEQVTVALADPSEDAVWLGTATGVMRYRPLTREFERFIVAGGARDLAFDKSDPFGGLYVLAAGGWQRLPRGAFATAPSGPPPAGRSVRPLRADEIEQRIPYLQTMGTQVLLDRHMRQFHFTSAAQVPGTEVYYLGTDGMGLVVVDALVAAIDPLPFGVLSSGVGAVVAAHDGVWVGSDETARRSGLTFVSDDFQRFAFEEGPPATGFRASVVRALAARGNEIWAGTDQGVVRVEPGGETRRLQTVDGLPDNDVFALAASPSRMWIATARGLAYVPSDTVVVERTEGPFVTALALAAAGDSAWVGYTEGLGLALPDGQVFVAPGGDTLPELRSAIVAVARLADTLVAATVDRLLWRVADGPWEIEPILGQVAPIMALAADAGGLWVGGRSGLARVRLAAHAVQPFPAPRDVPGAVRGIAPTERYVWVATERGLVRFAREAIDR